MNSRFAMKRASMLRRLALIAAVCGVGIVAAPSFAEKPGTGTVSHARGARRGLERPLPELKFNGSALSDCIEFLADNIEANVMVDWKELENQKIAKDTPVTLHVASGVPLRKALDLTLRAAAGASVLTFYMEDGVVWITSAEAESKDMVTRVYGIEDLLFEPTDYTNAPNLDLNAINQSGNNSGSGTGTGGGGGGGQGGNNLFGNPSTGGDTKQTSRTRNDRAEEIIKLIQDTVKPDIWQPGGATISYYRGKLIVHAPRSVQDMLAAPLN